MLALFSSLLEDHVINCVGRRGSARGANLPVLPLLQWILVTRSKKNDSKSTFLKNSSNLINLIQILFKFHSNIPIFEMNSFKFATFLT